MTSTTLTFEQRFKLSRFFEAEAPVSGPVQLSHRRVFIVPTYRGMGMVLTILLLLLIAFIYNNNLVYLLAFLLSSIFFVTLLHTFTALSGLVAQAGSLQPVFAGEAAGFVLTVNNPGPQPRMGLRATLEAAGHDFSLDAHASKTLRLSASARKRGWQIMPTVTLDSTYPLGFFSAWSPLRFTSKVLVYPKPSAVSLPLPLPEGRGQQQTGQRRSDRPGRDDFNGVRAYQDGDSLRQIHWKAYAKGQGLLSKQYAGEAAGTDLWLDYDNSPGNAEERISQLCRWVIDAEQAGLRYGMLLPGCKLGPDRGRQYYLTCLEALALV